MRITLRRSSRDTPAAPDRAMTECQLHRVGDFLLSTRGRTFLALEVSTAAGRFLGRFRGSRPFCKSCAA